jgi:hypothetical protein
MERYTAMYPCGQPGLPDEPVTTYVNSLRMTGVVPGSTMTRRAQIARHHDPTRECNVYVATASSSSESEPTPRHHGADDQWRARLDELAEERPFYTKSSAWTPSHASDNLHMSCLCRAKSVRRTAIDARRRTFLCRASPMRGMATGANAIRLQTSRAAAHLCHPRVPESDNNRHANGGANADGDASQHFRWASQNLTAAAMLLRGCLEPATS